MDGSTAVRIIGIGSSAGGVETLVSVVGALPRTFPGAIVVVQHVNRHGSALAEILSKAGDLPAKFADDGEELVDGHLYVAPPNHHVTIDPSRRLTLARSERVQFSRPAIDPLLISLALSFGPAAAALILSGANSDGTIGAWTVRQCGGIVLVQDPNTSSFARMSQSVIDFGAADFVLRVEQIPMALEALCRPGVADVFRRQNSLSQSAAWT